MSYSNKIAALTVVKEQNQPGRILVIGVNAAEDYSVDSFAVPAPMDNQYILDSISACMPRGATVQNAIDALISLEYVQETLSPEDTISILCKIVVILG